MLTVLLGVHLKCFTQIDYVSMVPHCVFQKLDLVVMGPHLNSLRPRQNGRLFADDTLKRIFLNENIRILTTNSLKFVPKGLINNIPALILIMAWRRPGDKPLSEPMLVRSLTHICVTRPQWVNTIPTIICRNLHPCRCISFVTEHLYQPQGVPRRP